MISGSRWTWYLGQVDDYHGSGQHPATESGAGVVGRRGGSARRRPPVSVAGGRHRQRQRVSQRGVDRLLRGARHRADAVQAVSEERPGLGRAEERRGRPPTWSGTGVWKGMPGAEALARVYSAARLFVNGFQPSFKLAEKTRVGTRVPQALPRAGDAVCAVARLGHGSRRDEGPSASAGRDPGSARVAGRDPSVQHHLAGLVAGSTVHPMPQRDADLDGFLRNLTLAWRTGEVRPTHRPRKRPLRSRPELRPPHDMDAGRPRRPSRAEPSAYTQSAASDAIFGPTPPAPALPSRHDRSLMAAGRGALSRCRLGSVGENFPFFSCRHAKEEPDGSGLGTP